MFHECTMLPMLSWAAAVVVLQSAWAQCLSIPSIRASPSLHENVPCFCR